MSEIFLWQEQLVAVGAWFFICGEREIGLERRREKNYYSLIDRLP